MHARNFPHLVRAAPPRGFFNPGAELRLEDVTWLVGFEPTAASRQESEALRAHVAGLEGSFGSNALMAPPVDTPQPAQQ